MKEKLIINDTEYDCVDGKILNYNYNKRFVKINYDPNELYQVLDDSGAFTLAVRLTKFISYDDCILRKGGHKNGHIFSAREIAEELNMPYSTFRRNLGTLNKNGIYKKHNIVENSYNIPTGCCIIANPDIFMRGSVVHPWVLALFDDYIWRQDSVRHNFNILKHYLRQELLDWKKTSIKFCSYKCIITGREFMDVHHLTPFQRIFLESLKNTDLDKYKFITDYTEQEYLKLKNELLRLHDYYGTGVCLNRDVHDLFHELYSYQDYTSNDFYDFVKRIDGGEFDNWFKEHNIPININYDAINNIFGIDKEKQKCKEAI